MRRCVRYKMVYSPKLGRKVKRCADFEGTSRGVGGLSGDIRSCVRYKEVYSPKLGKKVKRCAEFR